jgi:hypothetical protein
VLPLTVFFFLGQQLGSIAFPRMIDGAAVAPSLARALYTVIIGTALMTGGVWVLAQVIDYCAKTFEGKPDPAQAMKLAAYSGTGLWVIAGLFGLAPPLSLLAALGIVSIFTLYRGLPVLMRAPADKALPYAASVIAVAAVMAVVLMALSQCAAMVGGSSVRRAPVAVGAPAAPAPPVAAKVDPDADIDVEKMRRLLPDAIPGGWVRASLTRNNGGTLGFTGPTVEGVYENGAQRIVLRVIDLGRGRAQGAIDAARATLPAFASDRGVISHGEQQGRYVFTQEDRDTGVVRWLTVAGDRLAVAAEGSGGVTQAQLAEALALIDMVRVEQIAKGL